ncbi:MAG: hypothetical protein JEZ08_15175 [Clostridiales bacterium]|nr:hypothetical protein [Clostridiales bacterium]
MKRKIIDLIVIAIIIGLGISTYFNSQIIDVNTYQARKGKVSSTIRIEGEVVTKSEEAIYYKKDCIIEEILVSEGQEVRIGDPVFKINMNYDSLSVDNEESDLKLQLLNEKNRLEMKTSGQNSVVWQKVQLMKTELSNLKEDLSNDQALYDVGVITFDKLSQTRNQVASQQIAYDEALLNYSTNVASTELDIITIKKNIQEIKKQLNRIESGKSTYVSVDEEGIYYSTYRGVIKNIVEKDQVIEKDVRIANVAITGDVSEYKFIGYVDEEYNHLLAAGDEVEFYDGVIREPIKGRVLKVYDVIKDGKVRIDAEFLEDRAAKVGYGKEFYSEKVIDPIFENVIPKNCVIGNVDFKENETVEIFIVNNDIANRIKVKIVSIGDYDIGIEPLEKVDLDNVILDPSYKIKDGEEVR